MDFAPVAEAPASEPSITIQTPPLTPAPAPAAEPPCIMYQSSLSLPRAFRDSNCMAFPPTKRARKVEPDMSTPPPPRDSAHEQLVDRIARLTGLPRSIIEVQAPDPLGLPPRAGMPPRYRIRIRCTAMLQPNAEWQQHQAWLARQAELAGEVETSLPVLGGCLRQTPSSGVKGFRPRVTFVCMPTLVLSQLRWPNDSDYGVAPSTLADADYDCRRDCVPATQRAGYECVC